MLKDSGAGEETTTVVQRQELVRASAAVRELCAFMFSEEFEALAQRA
jgi:hypothetical protein